MELSERLGLPEPHIVGHLTYLWLWAIDSAVGGHLPESVRVIERAAWWTGPPGDFVLALIAVGFIDEEGGRLRIHDWDDYGGRLQERRIADRDRKRRSRAQAQDVTGESAGCPADVTRKSAPTQHNTTVQNSTEENDGGTASPAPTPDESSTDESAESEDATKGRPKRRRRIPADWLPSERDLAWATGLPPDGLNLPTSYVRSETARFVAWWTGDGGTKADWSATWKAWLHKEVKDGKAPGSRASPKPGRNGAGTAGAGPYLPPDQEIDWEQEEREAKERRAATA